MTAAPNILDLRYNYRKLLQIDKAREGLLNFTRHTFPDYEINWHHRRIAAVLNRFANGELKRLILTMPPRHGKTELFSCRLPAFIFGKNPDARIIAGSYSDDLASRNNRTVQRIINSSAYVELFPYTKIGQQKINGVITQQNSSFFEVIGHRGSYRSVGVGGGVTGMGGDFLLLDDPIKNREEADSKVYRDKLWEWWASTFYTRAEKDACIGITVTRWHEDDVVGRLLKLAAEDPLADQWLVINFPAVAEAPTEFDFRNPGEPLWPGKYPLLSLDKIRASIGIRNWTALYQQRPAPDQGLIVKREWWRYYTKLPQAFDKVVQAWDLRFTDSKQSGDYVAGVVLGRKGADIYLLDLVHGRLSFTESIQAFESLSRKWPTVTAKYVEEAANGFALIDTLRRKIQGIIAVKPQGSKVARVNAVAPIIEAGNFWLPDPSIAPWIHSVVNEWTGFPAAMHDDIVDAMTHGGLKLSTTAPDNWLPVSITGQSFAQL